MLYPGFGARMRASLSETYVEIDSFRMRTVVSGRQPEAYVSVSTYDDYLCHFYLSLEEQWKLFFIIQERPKNRSSW